MSNEPTFKKIFGEDWDALPLIIKRHYANRPYTNDASCVEGTLDLLCKGHIRLLSPLFWLLGGIPPVTEKNVPVTVHFTSDINNSNFHFHRIFNFENKKPYHFRSSMLQLKNNEVIEIMRFGICWRMNYLWENEKVVLRHKGYAIRIFGFIIPMPITFLFGRTDAEEAALSDDIFSMRVTITHPWFGTAYEYKGQFRVTKEI